jgi:nucleoside triphosphate pyrophosphatase
MLVLASNSPRRRQLLALGGWDFVLLAAPVNERVLPGEAPGEYVLRLAQAKARAAQALLETQAAAGRSAATEMIPAVIVAADTAVVDLLADLSEAGIAGPGQAILGKPIDAIEAEAMLRRLRGHTHQVYTGLAALRTGDDQLLSDVVVTDVPMRNYSDEEMHAYIASGDPLDKAGAYGIQHPGFRPVQNLQGCYANVMGLPLCHLARLLGSLGVYPINEVALACQKATELVPAEFPCTVRLTSPLRPAIEYVEVTT